MAEITGNDTGDGYGVFGTSNTAVGVRGSSGTVKLVLKGPPAKAGVLGSGHQGGYGVLGSSDDGDGVHGVSNYGSGVSGLSHDSHGVLGISTASGISSVRGDATGTGAGVEGNSTTSPIDIHGGIGVVGRANNYSSIGVVGECTNGIGVRGQQFADFSPGKFTEGPFPNVGVHGYSDWGFGVVAQSDQGDALVAWPGLQYGQAAVLHGDVQIDGNLTKGGGGFKIDHPVDPANKYLIHSFVESSERKNVYDGVATLNAKGEAEVRLPKWFDSLNTDFCYQLTALGFPAPNLHISQQLRGNAFRIAGGKSKMKVSWQVTGVRKDHWAKANPFTVEEKKAGKDRGKFLHPKAHGESEKNAITRRPKGPTRLRNLRKAVS